MLSIDRRIRIWTWLQMYNGKAALTLYVHRVGMKGVCVISALLAKSRPVNGCGEASTMRSLEILIDSTPSHGPVISPPFRRVQVWDVGNLRGHISLPWFHQVAVYMYILSTNLAEI